MRFNFPILAFAVLAAATATRSDQTLYRYEGNVLPYDPSAGWIIADECESPCSESLLGGVFRLSWPTPAEFANYNYTIAQPPIPPPATLWVETRFRSNHPLGPNFFTCDGQFSIRYGGTLETTLLYGDAAISFSGDSFVTGLALNEFHLLRYESVDGVNFRIAVDGRVFFEDLENQPNGFHYLQMRGVGGCTSDWVPNMVNEWDFVRYGTIGTGEQVVSTVPVSGALGPGAYTSFTSFLVTFDQPNYVYIDDITVTVTSGVAPVVTATRRDDTHDEHTIEIVLDRALPPNELTAFTLSDGQTTNVINYDFRANPSSVPASSTSGLLGFTVALLVAAYLMVRGRTVTPA